MEKVIYSFISICLFLCILYTFIRLYKFNKYMLNFSEDKISLSFADKLLSITTEDKRKIPYFSAEDQHRIKSKWKKEGYIKEDEKV